MASYQRSTARCPILLLLVAFGALALLIPSPAYAQSRQPLNKVELLVLLTSSGSSQRMARLVEQQGIDFEPTDEYVQILIAAGAKERLVQALNKAEVVESPTPTVSTQEILLNHVAQGAELVQKELYPQAERGFRAALQLDSENPSLYAALGRVLVLRDDADGAIVELEEAIRLDPEDSWTHDDLGYALAEKGDLDEAIAEFREAIRLDPEDAWSHANLGLALAQKEDVAGAIAEIAEFLKVLITPLLVMLAVLVAVILLLLLLFLLGKRRTKASDSA